MVLFGLLGWLETCQCYAKRSRIDIPGHLKAQSE